MKTCVSSYSFGGYINEDKLGMMGVIEKVKEFGFDGIEFTDGDWMYDPEMIKKIKEKCASLGLPIVSLCVGADFTNGSGGDLEAEIARVKKLVDIASGLGAAAMRHDVSGGIRGRSHSLGYDDALPRIAEGCRKVTEYAAEKGVVTMTENHGYFSQDANRVEKLMNATAHPNFGALVDIGNFMCADEDPTLSVAIMAKYAKHVHAKDFYLKSGNEINPGSGWFGTRAGNYLKGTIVGHGDAKVAQSLRTIKNSGYDGYVSIEFEGMEDNLTAIKIGLENIKRYIG